MVAAVNIKIMSFSLLISQLWPNQAVAFEDERASFLVGEYKVIGKKPDSDETYFGDVSIKIVGNGLSYSRVVGGVMVAGEAAIEGATPDKIPVLRVKFVENGVKHEGTFLWSSDLDNYARISGYIYRPGVTTKAPGLEALFMKHD